LVEALNGCLFAFLVYRFGPQFFVIVLMLFVSILLTISFIDLDHQIIPDVLSLPGIAIGFLSSFVIPWIDWLDSLIGIVLGGGSLLVIAWSYEKLTGKEGMGGGDIKLLAMLGAFLGWSAIFPIVFLSSLIGSLVGVPWMLFKKKDAKFAIPFGPFLAAAAVVYLFWGGVIIRWYLSLFR
jgi:leader peptidase (prepilin peptidase)/N-methyltransferase